MTGMSRQEVARIAGGAGLPVAERRLARKILALYDQRDEAYAENERLLADQVPMIKVGVDLIGQIHALRSCVNRLRDGKWKADVEHGQWITRASYDDYDNPCFEAEPMTPAEQAVMTDG